MKNRISIFLLVCLLMFLSTPSNGDVSHDIQRKYTEIPASASSKIKKKALESAVKIIHEGTGGYGSGSYISIDGEFLVLTAAHVVDDKCNFLVQNGHEVVSSEVIFRDDVNDIAFLKVQQMKTRTALKYKTNTAKSMIGEPVLYAGYPDSNELLLFFGNIAGYNNDVILMHSYAWMGASGSIVLDLNGKIVGVLSAVSVGDVWGLPQLIEDIIWVSDINKIDIKKIRAILKGADADVE